MVFPCLNQNPCKTHTNYYTMNFGQECTKNSFSSKNGEWPYNEWILYFEQIPRNKWNIFQKNLKFGQLRLWKYSLIRKYAQEA